MRTITSVVQLKTELRIKYLVKNGAFASFAKIG